jgi:putative oxidoreductase
MGALTLGLISGGIGLALVAALETSIGVLLITGRYLRLGLGLLALAMIGILSPLVLFPGRLFAGPTHAPTLEGQYVLKDIVLLAAVLVVAVGAPNGRVGTAGDEVVTAGRDTETQVTAGWGRQRVPSRG